jgi:hypothetical protein
MRDLSRIYRLIVVHAAVLTLVGTSVYAVVSQQEFWPFCNYRMFSHLAGKEGPRGLEVRFVEDGEETTFNYTTILLVRQFNIHGLNATLRAFGWRCHGNGRALRMRLMASCLLC